MYNEELHDLLLAKCNQNDRINEPVSAGLGGKKMEVVKDPVQWWALMLDSATRDLVGPIRDS